MPFDFSSLHAPALAVATLLLCIAAATDARTRRIPNWTSAGLLILFPVFFGTSPLPVQWSEHLISFAVVLAIGFIVYEKKWCGAGDIKLLSVLALWAGSDFIALLLFITATTGGLLSLLVALSTLLRRRMKKDTDTTPIRALPVSYGLAIGIGGLCVFLMLSHRSFIIV